MLLARCVTSMARKNSVPFLNWCECSTCPEYRRECESKPVNGKRTSMARGATKGKKTWTWYFSCQGIGEIYLMLLDFLKWNCLASYKSSIVWKKRIYKVDCSNCQNKFFAGKLNPEAWLGNWNSTWRHKCTKMKRLVQTWNAVAAV